MSRLLETAFTSSQLTSAMPSSEKAIVLSRGVSHGFAVLAV